MVLYLYLAVIVVALSGCVGTPELCPASSRATSLNLSVASRRNITGHWIVSMDVASAEAKRALLYTRPRQVALDVEHGTASCELYEAVQFTVIATVSPTPPPGYEVVNGLGYYKLHTTALTWEGARDKCVQEGGHLIVINSDQEADVVRTFFARKPKILGASSEVYAHVGFHDRYVEGEYITVLGGSLESSGYVGWDVGLPNKLDHQDCGIATKDARYHDGPCSWTLFFVCEFEAK